MSASSPSPASGQTPDAPRRQALLRGFTWIGAALATLFLYPLLRFTGHRIPPKPRLIEVPAPLPLSGVHSHHDFLLIKAEDAAQPPVAVSRICTHLGCRVNFQQDRQLIECPCHQSRFTPHGERVSGPAQRNLPSYEVSLKHDADGRVIAYVVHL